ncbi:hypothetical protein LCGC14_2649010 [marine sediment metagenome]|uniref:Uncharacterized protein n=1 Tax=marine sediment metagenome TaxID=412755 RepID=A0A0F9C5R8_9ZZZZ
MPVFVFSFFRVKGIDVTFSLLRRLSGLTLHECFQTIKKISGTFPEYATRDRKQVILKKINEIKYFFHLNSLFFENASKILQKLWGILNNTTDRIVAGTVSALALISIHNNSLKLSFICQKIEIAHSSVIYQVKKLVKNLGFTGFTKLNESQELLCSEVLKKVIGIQVIVIK